MINGNRSSSYLSSISSITSSSSAKVVLCILCGMMLFMGLSSTASNKRSENVQRSSSGQSAYPPASSVVMEFLTRGRSGMLDPCQYSRNCTACVAYNSNCLWKKRKGESARSCISISYANVDEELSRDDIYNYRQCSAVTKPKTSDTSRNEARDNVLIFFVTLAVLMFMI